MEVGRICQGGQTSLDFNIGQIDVAINAGNIGPTAYGDAKDKEISKQSIKKAVDKLNKFLDDDKVHVEYEVHDKLKDLMIKIVDDKTNEVIMELPPKKILDMVAKMCEKIGIIVDKKA